MFDIVKSRVSLLQVVENEGIHLKKTGGTYKSLCPFHKEKTPSFTVNSNKNTYKCFGCGESGSVIDFYMKKHNLDLVEAAKELAEKYGVELPETPKELKEIQRHFKKNKEFIERIKKNNDKAVQYLIDRGFSEETIKQFDVGYSKEKGLKDESVLDDWCNLSIKNEYGQVVARARRRIGTDIKPKWLNTFESRIYSKHKILYNLNEAKRHCNNRIYIMEGYFDVMAYWEQGIKNTVGYCSSSITESQASLLSKYITQETEIVYVPDNDETGRNTIEKNYNMLRKYNPLNCISICEVVNGCKDPNDIILKGLKLEELKNISAERFILMKKLENKDINNQYTIAKHYCNKVSNSMILSDITKDLSEMWDKTTKEVKEYLEHNEIDEEEILADFITLENARDEYIDETLNGHKKNIKTGFFSLDLEIKGIRKGEILTCQARPGSGKTAFMLNFAIFAALNDKNVILFSQEQKAFILYEKIQGILNKMPIDEINKNVRNGKSIDVKNFSKIKNKIYIIEKAGITADYIDKIVRVANRNLFDNNTDLIILDYVQMCQGKKNSKREIMEDIILKEKVIAKNHKIAVCNLSQVSRQNNNELINEGAAPTGMGMAKESGAIEEGSDYIIGLWRESRNPKLSEEEKKILKNHIGINLIKTKRGEAGKKFEFMWFGDMQIIEDKYQPRNMDNASVFQEKEIKYDDDLPELFKEF